MIESTVSCINLILRAYIFLYDILLYFDTFIS